MSNNIQNWLLLKGRLLMALLFGLAGFGKIMNWDGTLGYMVAKGMPLAPLFLTGAIVFLLAGSISLSLGLKTKMGALLLILFLLPTTFIFHDFWNLEGQEMAMQQAMFMKNLAIMGGLFYIFAAGAGAYSLDAKTRRFAKA